MNWLFLSLPPPLPHSLSCLKHIDTRTYFKGFFIFGWLIGIVSTSDEPGYVAYCTRFCLIKLQIKINTLCSNKAHQKEEPMRFNSEAERMHHPLVSLIPQPLWDEYFLGYNSDAHLPLIHVDAPELDALVESMKTSTLDQNTKQRIWLLLGCRPVILDDGTLLHFLKKLSFEPTEQLNLAAMLGKSNLVRTVLINNPDNAQKIISSADYEGPYAAFRLAAKHGHLSVMECLIEKLTELAPDKVQEMIAARDYEAFFRAAGNAHLPVMERLMALAPDKVQEMIAAGDYLAFRWAVRNGRLPVVNHLLQFASVFAYAEAHDHEYGSQYVYPFVTQQLTSLRALKAAFEAGHPDGVFNIEDPEQSRLCFYMLRNLIRRNDTALVDEMVFLMDIPSVKALLHTEMTASRGENELLRLAIHENNQAAAALLLRIPAVHAHAVAHNFYRAERVGGLDLAALAQNRESSMTGLTEGEQNRLAKVTGRYTDTLQFLTAPNIMALLRETLIERYEANPAQITQADGTILHLPMAWGDFEALQLNPEDKAQALKAYYQQTSHTAWRYLEKPNPWMSPHAAYVYINDAHTERWSTFEEYQPLISMLFLAAKDEAIAPCDGYTLETRMEHFIEELAHINRAHNWDNSRTNTKGAPEEYDDLRGDRPSCYSGVKRRLFQSVQGHPLLKIVTLDDIKEEMRSFVRAHFEQMFLDNPTQVPNWQKAWDALMDGDTGERVQFLLKLAVPEEKQSAFIDSLSDKYGNQSTLGFVRYIEERFEDNSANHVMTFGGITYLSELLEKHADKATPSQAGLFGGKQAAEGSSSAADEKPAHKK
jgi:hypothetical protein